MKNEKMTQKDFDAAEANKRKKGQWTNIIEQIKKDGVPQKITGLTRGQVAALYRTATQSGLRIVANYKDCTVSLAPAK